MAQPARGLARSAVEAGEEDDGAEQRVAGEAEAPTQAGAVTAEQNRDLFGPAPTLPVGAS